MARDSSPSGGFEFIVTGAVLGVIGTAMLLDSEASGGLTYVGAALAWVGGILTMIGVIAAGVTIGFRRADWKIRGLDQLD